jgi:uncharacterized protein involved in type VI secretion and phage assembly
MSPDDSKRRTSDERLAGVHLAVVVDDEDPAQLGRVAVRSAAFPDPARVWARVAVPRAGPQRGTWFVPAVGDEVILAFEGGDPSRPYVIGSVWSKSQAPPEQMTSGNPVMSLVSAAGSRVTIDDRADRLSIRLETPGGRSVTLSDGEPAITVDDGNGGSITMTPSGVDIRAPGQVRVSAATVKVTATLVELEAGMTKARGTVQCQTIIADSVVASSYTPGTGNIW